MSETTPEAAATPTPGIISEGTEAPAQGDPASEERPPRHVPVAELAKERERRKAAEDRLAEFERANESAVERAQREAQEAKAEVEKLPNLVAAQLRDHLVRVHDISDDDRDLFLTGGDPETLLKQVARLVERTPTNPKPDPSQGAKGSGAKGTPADSFAEFFQSQI